MRKLPGLDWRTATRSEHGFAGSFQFMKISPLIGFSEAFFSLSKILIDFWKISEAGAWTDLLVHNIITTSASEYSLCL
jgi:hypothetical protein